jgi:hypothetical protein
VRYANILLGVLMMLFAAVQYNDPDALLWIVIYLIPAAWAFTAAFRLPRVTSKAGTALLWATLAIALGALVYYWPQTPAFWRKDVWWNDEEAREGMGVMIAFAVLLFVLLTAFTARIRRS